MPDAQIKALTQVKILKLQDMYMGTNTIRQWLTYYDEMWRQYDREHHYVAPTRPIRKPTTIRDDAGEITNLGFKSERKQKATTESLKRRPNRWRP
jgi:hypothetical protein